jgi:RecA/RadA recombinase
MSQALRKLTGVASRTNCTIIFINQLRHKVGLVNMLAQRCAIGYCVREYLLVHYGWCVVCDA